MKNNKKYVFIIIAFIVIIISIVFILYFKNNSNNVIENLDYILVTDMNEKSLQNDGGSHFNDYYIIDFENMIITKYRDKYKGFVGYKYKKYKLYDKQLTETENTNLKKLIDIIIDSKNEELDYKKSDWLYYSLIITNEFNDNYENINDFLNMGECIYYNDYDVINEIESILEK